MSNTASSPIEGFVLLKFHSGALASKGLPAVSYPVPSTELDTLLDADNDIQPAQLLAWIQRYVSDANAPWRDYRAAMETLVAICTPANTPEVINAKGDNWSVVCADVDLNSVVVSFCRDGELLGAVEKNPDGRLRVACYQPLDGNTLSRIVGFSMLPAPDGTVCMRPNNWEYLVDNSCGTAQFYAATAGRSYMALWEKGYGIAADGSRNPDWYPTKAPTPLPAAMLATSIGIYYELASDA